MKTIGARLNIEELAHGPFDQKFIVNRFKDVFSEMVVYGESVFEKNIRVLEAQIDVREDNDRKRASFKKIIESRKRKLPATSFLLDRKYTIEGYVCSDEIKIFQHLQEDIPDEISHKVINILASLGMVTLVDGLEIP